MKSKQDKSTQGQVSALAEPKDQITPELVVKIRNWYDGLSIQAKLASVLLLELLAHQNELADKDIGQDIRDKLHSEVISDTSKELDFLRGLYTTLDSMNS